jgi:purine-cytosine permease-like protein
VPRFLLSSVFPRFNRVQATFFIGVLSIAFIFIGRFALNLTQSISTFATLIITCTAPWMVVMALGFVTRRGWYDSEDLQVFNRRQRGGRYWFAHGWNWRGMGTWVVSAVVALLFTNLPGQFVGPLGNLANGADISLPVGLALAVVLYLAALVVFPEPRAVFGPAGPRFVRASDAEIAPITGGAEEKTPEPAAAV